MKKTVLITGAGGNLGVAAVQQFLSAGYKVLAVVSPGKIPTGIQNDVEYSEADLFQEKEVDMALRTIISRNPVINAALLLVGGFEPGGIDAADGDSLNRMYAINFKTAYFVARPVFQQMMGQPDGGRIVFIGARPALEVQAGKNLVAYGLSKSLLFKLSEYLNATAMGKNVVSVVIVPATIDTPANRKAMTKADFSKWVTPESIAEIIAFVASSTSPLRDPVLKVYGGG